MTLLAAMLRPLGRCEHIVLVTAWAFVPLCGLVVGPIASFADDGGEFPAVLCTALNLLATLVIVPLALMDLVF